MGRNVIRCEISITEARRFSAGETPHTIVGEAATLRDVGGKIRELKAQVPGMYQGKRWYCREIYEDGGFGAARLCKDETPVYDKNDVEITHGAVVKIEGGYFKADDGLFRAVYVPGDDDWGGSDVCLHRINRDGSESKSKYKTAFWPLSVTVSSRETCLLARAHNKEHATIEVIPEPQAR